MTFPKVYYLVFNEPSLLYCLKKYIVDLLGQRDLLLSYYVKKCNKTKQSLTKKHTKSCFSGLGLDNDWLGKVRLGLLEKNLNTLNRYGPYWVVSCFNLGGFRILSFAFVYLKRQANVTTNQLSFIAQGSLSFSHSFYSRYGTKGLSVWFEFRNS